MYTNTNPAELYNGTTWELITSGKYIQTGTTPLSTGGNNSVTIGKTNLPNIKLKVDSHSHTQPAHTHSLYFNTAGGYSDIIDADNPKGNKDYLTRTESAGGENTGTASPSTESLGSGTALNIQPAYITLKFWKRLT